MATEPPLVNNGERLYYKNLAHDVLRQNKLEEAKKNEEENFTMEFRFQPNINKNENDKYSNIQSKFLQNTIATTKSTEEEQNRKTIEPKTEEEIKQMINRLHSESKKLKENKEKLYANQTTEECPFTPKINVQGKADPKYFMMRLEKWSKSMEEKFKKKEGEKNRFNVDQITGQKLFQPKVDDPVAKKLKRENNDVHSDLYQKGLEHIKYRKNIMETDTRDDLKQIENKKLEKINKLKEERDRYKKEKQEKLDKKLYERSLKVKAEKENIDKILKERIQKGKKEDNKNKNKNTQPKNINNKGKEEKKPKKKNKLDNIFHAGGGLSSLQNKFKRTKNEPLNPNKRANTEVTKLKSTKDKKENKNILKKIPVKKDNNERAKSQLQKNKKEILGLKEKNNTIVTESRKNKKIISNKKDVKNVNKNEKTKEIEIKKVENTKKKINKNK